MKSKALRIFLSLILVLGTGLGLMGAVYVPGSGNSPVVNVGVIPQVLNMPNLSATPAAPPPSGRMFLYFRAGTLYKLTSAGTESAIAGGGGGGGDSYQADETTLHLDGDTNTFGVADGGIGGTQLAGGIAWSKLASGTSNRLIVTAPSGEPTVAPAITSGRALISDSNGVPTYSTVTAAVLAYIANLSSDAQTQIDGKAAASHTHSTDDLTSGTLGAARGGTGNAYFSVSGPASSTKTYALPNASSTILTDNAAVTVAQGGTGLTSLTTHALPIGNGTSAPTLLTPGTSGYVLTSGGPSADPSWQAPSGGRVAQVVETSSASTASSSANVPFDNSIPQSNEGAAYSDLDTTITPTNASSKLRVELQIHVAANAAGNVRICLFRDSGADAIYAVAPRIESGTNSLQLANLAFTVSAGSTNATTFKVRYGNNGTNLTYINGSSAIFGGVMTSSLRVTEYLP